MKKLLIAIAAAATAIGTYAATAIGGAGFDSGDTAEKYTWDKDGGFNAKFWSGTADTTTLTSGDCGFLDDARPAGYAVSKTDFMAVKTTFGQPITQNILENGSGQLIGDGFYYDGLVKFTACDETPDLTAEAYEGAKIGFFPLLDSDEDGADTYLYIWSNGGTNLWKTTKKIDDTKWYRVTIKMIANANRTGDAQAAFVVFIDGKAVDCVDAQAAFTEANLTPAAKKWWTNGQLFASLDADGTEVTGVLYDGQGSIDDVGFADEDDAPDFAIDDKFMTVSAGENITEFTVDGQTWTTGADPLDVNITDKDSITITGIKCATGHFVDPDFVTIAKDDFADAISVADKVTVKEANFSVGTTKSETWADAVAVAVGGEVTITLEGEDYVMTDADLLASINNEDGVTTIDFNGKTITGCIYATTDVAFVNEGDEGGIVGVDIDDSGLKTAVMGVATVYVSGGQFDGWVIPTAETKGITGGKFLEQAEQTEFYLTPYVADGYVGALDAETGYWTVQEYVPETAEVTINAGDNLTLAVTTEDGTIIESGAKVEVGTVLTITATPDEYYTLASLKVNDADFTSGSTYEVESGDPITIAATASATVWTITYIDNGDQVGTDTYTVENREEKKLLTLDPKAGYTFDGWYIGDDKVTSLAGKTGALTLTAKWTEDAFVVKIDDTKYDTFAAALKAAKPGDTITLGQDINEPGIELAVSQFPGTGLTIDLNNHTYTFTKDAKGTYKKDCFTIQTNDVITIKNGTIAVAAKQADDETDTNFRDVIRLYGNADSTLNLVNVKFDGTNLKALDPESKPVCVFSIEGGWFNIDANSEIDAGSATYAIKLGNHANKDQYEVKTLTNKGKVTGDILITGGVYAEDGATVTGTYWYGKNAYSTWADGVTSTLFAARIGGEPAEGEEDCACGKLYKTLAAAAQAATAGDIVTIAKAGAFEEATVEFAAAATFVVGSLADVSIGTLTLNGTKISIAEGGKLTNAGDIAGSIITSFTKLENTYTGSAVSPVVPGDPITTGDPATLANLINTDASVKAQYFKAPEGAKVGASYAAMFVAAPDGDSAVKFVLTEAAEAQLQENANGEIIKIKPSEIAALTGESGEFKVEKTIPGFYYAVKQGNGIGNMKVVEAGVLATDDKGVDLLFKKYDGAGFYSIVVSEKAIPAE